MTTPKPGRGPDTDAGRRELLARLQLIKGEVDAVLGPLPSTVIGVLWLEVHGGPPEQIGAFLLPGASVISSAGKFGLPAADRRLGSASELFSIAFLLLGYADFVERGWLREALHGGEIWKGGDCGVEAVHVCTFAGTDLQQFLRKAILAVARSVVAPKNRRDYKNEQVVKDVLRKMADVLKRPQVSKAPKGQSGRHLYQERKLTRIDFEIPPNRRGVMAGDPPRQIRESDVLAALRDAQRRKLLGRSGTTSNSRYWFTEKGWEYVHSTVQTQQLGEMMLQAPVEVTVTPTRVSFLSAKLGKTVSFSS
jgi:hypothetical protein